MVWYVALIAILNLALGYAIALYLGCGRKHAVCVAEDLDAAGV